MFRKCPYFEFSEKTEGNSRYSLIDVLTTATLRCKLTRISISDIITDGRLWLLFCENCLTEDHFKCPEFLKAREKEVQEARAILRGIESE
jgi:hypothetical protein